MGLLLAIQIQSPEMTVVRNFAELQSVVKDYADTQIIMVVMDRTMAQKYGFIKKYLACQLGVLSQVSRKGFIILGSEGALFYYYYFIFLRDFIHKKIKTNWVANCLKTNLVAN